MKIINALFVIFALHFSSCATAQQDAYFVSPQLSGFGVKRINDQLVRWIYYGFSPDNSCLYIELLEPLTSVSEGKVDICELFVEDFKITVDTSNGYIENVKIGESEVTFTASLAFQRGADRILECLVPIKDKKIHPVECTVVGNGLD